MILIIILEVIKLVLIFFGVCVLINLIPTGKKPKEPLNEPDKEEYGKYGKWWEDQY